MVIKMSSGIVTIERKQPNAGFVNSWILNASEKPKPNKTPLQLATPILFILKNLLSNRN